MTNIQQLTEVMSWHLAAEFWKQFPGVSYDSLLFVDIS